MSTTINFKHGPFMKKIVSKVCFLIEDILILGVEKTVEMQKKRKTF